MTEHPLEVFRFCPKCGSQDFEIHNALSRHCAQCGFTFYQNPRASTAAFILNDKDELLVATRGKEPAKGTLDLPISSQYPTCISTQAWTYTRSTSSLLAVYVRSKW